MEKPSGARTHSSRLAIAFSDEADDMVRCVPLLAFLLLATSCSTDERRKNQGAVCVLSDEGQQWDQPQVFSAGAPLRLKYILDDCLSSSCDTDREASCDVVLEGDLIRVETRAKWTAQTGIAACTSDCGLLTASCTTPPLPEGTYTVRSGDQETVVTVPSQSERAPCTRQPPW